MKMKKVLVSLLVGVGLMVGISSQAFAVAFIEHDFVGVVTDSLANPFGLTTGSGVSGSAIYDRDLLPGASFFFTDVDGTDLNSFRFDFGSFSLTHDQANNFPTTPPAMKFEDALDGSFNPITPGVAELTHFDFIADFTFMGGSYSFIMDGFSTIYDPFADLDLARFDILDLNSNNFVVTGVFNLPDLTFDPQNQPVIPEPSTIILLGMGLGGLAVLRNRQKKA